MTNQESWNLFQRLSGRENMNLSESEDRLLDLLQRLPLAIAQAAAYIRKTKVSVQQYLQFFNESESRQSNLLSQEFPDVYRSDVPNSVMHTWLISKRKIAEENPCGERILNIIAFLDNKGLPFELLKAAAGPDFDEDEVLLAASRLVKFSFLQAQRAVDLGLPTYEQHRLVHMATRQALTQMQTFSFSGEALRIMADLFPNGTRETRASCELYLPHALKAAAWVNAKAYSSQTPPLLERIGYYYWGQGRPNEAEQPEVQVLALYKEVLGEKHPGTILAMGNLASTWNIQSRLPEAEQLKAQVLELSKEVLGEKHLNTNLAIGNLARTWYKQGRLDEAEQLQVQVIKVRKEVLGEKHPDTIFAMGDLAGTWYKQGWLDKAEQLEVQVLEVRNKVFGEKHPNTIIAMGNLARTWYDQGRFGKAEQLQVQVVKLRKEVLGEKHPNTILAIGNLARTWYKQGRFNEAEQLEVQVVKVRKEVLGEKHPDTILAIASLEATQRKQGCSS